MYKKTLLCLLLALSVFLSLTACGGAVPLPSEATLPPTQETSLPDATPLPVSPPDNPTPSETPDDPQIVALFYTLPSLQQDSSREWRYAVTDLDHNGKLELLAASQHQADRSTTLRIWELNENMDALNECAIPLDEDESFPDILAENADTYYNSGTGVWSYLFYDNILLSEHDAYTAKCAVTLRDGTLRYESYAFQSVSEEKGVRTISYFDLNGKEITPEEYNAVGQTTFAGTLMSSTNFGWFRYEDATDSSCLTNSYAVFTGERSPDKTNPLPRPQPLGAVDPYEASAPGAAPLFLYITKNPTNEKREEGQTAYFIAISNIYTSLSWTFVSPDGKEYTPQTFANKFPGVAVNGIYSTTLSIAKLTKETDGWGAYCTFNYNGQTARTNTAYLNVTEKKAEPSPSPSAAPTATPAPSATPSPTASPAPTDAPAPTASPAPADTPAPTTEPAPIPSGDIIAQGGFSSDTGTLLNLCCDWTAVRTGEDMANVVLRISIRSATIRLNKLDKGIRITFDKQSADLTQPAVDYKGGMTTTYLGSATFPVELADGSNEFPMNVVWHFNGSYGGKTLKTIECGGNVVLTEAPEPEPEPEPEPVLASMAGTVTAITDEQYTIELANGLTVSVDPSICRLAYGSLEEGCSCTVYYTDSPSAETIYLVDLYGVEELEPEPDAPAMIGSYKDNKNLKMEIMVKAAEKEEYTVTVLWTKEGGEKIKWVFHGKFDDDSVLSYTDCVKTTERTIAGGQTTEQQEYKDGHGKLIFDAETNRLTWKDEKEDIAKDLFFEKIKEE